MQLAGGRRVLVAVAGVVVVGLMAGAALWLAGGDGAQPADPDDDMEALESQVTVLGPEDAIDLETGLSIRPHVQLNHPSGASADVPAAPVLYGENVDLRRVTLPDDSTAWDWDGFAWQFVSNGGLVIADDVTFYVARHRGIRRDRARPLPHR